MCPTAAKGTSQLLSSAGEIPAKNQILFKPSECSHRATTVQEIPLHSDPTENTRHPADGVVLE